MWLFWRLEGQGHCIITSMQCSNWSECVKLGLTILTMDFLFWLFFLNKLPCFNWNACRLSLGIGCFPICSNLRIDRFFRFLFCNIFSSMYVQYAHLAQYIKEVSKLCLQLSSFVVSVLPFATVAAVLVFLTLAISAGERFFNMCN